MYLVLMVQHNRVFYAKAFRNFDFAAEHADQLVMDQTGVGNEMPNWEDNEYRNAFEAPNGVVVMIEPCEEPATKEEKITGCQW